MGAVGISVPLRPRPRHSHPPWALTRIPSYVPRLTVYPRAALTATCLIGPKPSRRSNRMSLLPFQGILCAMRDGMYVEAWQPLNGNCVVGRAEHDTDSPVDMCVERFVPAPVMRRRKLPGFRTRWSAWRTRDLIPHGARRGADGPIVFPINVAGGNSLLRRGPARTDVKYGCYCGQFCIYSGWR